MPGTFPAVLGLYLQPEPMLSLARTVIDVYRDVIARVQGGEIIDNEATDIRLEAQASYTANLSSGDPDQPYRDRTWAINQATGGRWDRAVTPDHQTDPLAFGADTPIPERQYPLNRELPSHNRHPGTIFIPPGDHYIFGTIVLYAGQQLIGASAADGGSRLIKVGRGPCIRVTTPADLVAQPELDIDLVSRLYREGEVRARGNQQGPLRLRAVATVRIGRENRDLDVAPVLTEGQREAAIVDVQSASATPFVIRNLGITHVESFRDDLPERVRRVGAPANDVYARSLDGSHRLTTVQQPPDPRLDVPWRRDPYAYDSGAIEVVNGLSGVLEDLVIEGFTLGFGILGRARSHQAIAWNGTVRRCRISGCHRGIALAGGFFNALPEKGADRVISSTPEATDISTGARLSRSGGNNSWTIEDCEVVDFGAAGIELRAYGSSRILFSQIGPPSRPNPAVAVDEASVAPLVLSADSTVVHGCRLLSDGPHIVMPPVYQPGDLRVATGDVGQVASASWNIVVAEGANFWLLQNTFRSARGFEARPRVFVPEFPNRNPLAPDGVAGRPVLRDLWASSGGRGSWLASSIDVSAPQLSPETTWSLENLLCNTMFEAVRDGRLQAPVSWEWRGAVEGDVRAKVIEVREPGFNGPVVRVYQGAQAPSNFRPPPLGAPTTFVVQLVQRLVHHWSPADPAAAWDERNRIRGKNLVAGCWVKTGGRLGVRLGFEEVPTPELQGDTAVATRRVFGRRYEGQGGDWRLLSAYIDPVSRDFREDVEAGNRRALWGLDFVIELTLPLTKERDPRVYALVGAPQVSFGPYLLPVGPPTVKLSRADGERACLRERVKVPRQSVDDARIDVGPSGTGRLPFGRDGELQGLTLDLGREKSGYGATFVVERLQEGKATLLMEFRVKDGRVEAVPKADLPVEVRRGGLLRLRRTSGAPRPATLVATVLRAEVI